ncbi:MAG: hypothetical protein HYU25_10810 [Candidatus Rokubacteria bacterium]|nr:hypothetical protein [Candidatus Rokubacteria bacterium]
MAEFKRIKVRAVLESDVMLITADQIDRLVDGVCGKLKNTGLTLVSVEPEEVEPTTAAIPVYDD